MSVESSFLEFAAGRLTQRISRIEECVAKLTPEQVWWRASDNQNAVGNLLLHLAGNVRQWILSGVCGDPDIRVRHQEFDARSGASPEELLAGLRKVVEEASARLRSLPVTRLAERRVIQGYDTTVLDAIFNVVEHFGGHTFQIIFVTKMLTGEDLGFYRELAKTGHRPPSGTTQP